jgi:hypothetical protein
MQIGRRSTSAGIEPEVGLSGPLAYAGVEITPHERAPLHDGTRSAAPDRAYWQSGYCPTALRNEGMTEADQLLHVTVVSALGQLTLGLPADDPVGTLLPELLASAGLYPSPAAAPADEWQLAVTDGAVVSADRSLAEQGIGPGAVLHLRGLVTARRSWAALVRADRQYFDSMTEADAGPMEFPIDWPQRRVLLTGMQMQIGRRSTFRGSEPDIDLSGPPADFGVSRQHAVLLAAPDGSWALVDQGSASGTRLNGVEVTPHQPAPLHDGDQISLGRWTVLTIRVG